MSIRYKLFIAFSIVVLLATGVATYGIKLVSDTSALVVRLYDGPMMAVSYARSAQWHLTQARHALERAMLLRDSVSDASLASIEKSMAQFTTDMAVVRERATAAGSTGAASEVDSVLSVANEWFKQGMNFIKPPASGLTELPRPSIVFDKSNAVMNAMELLVENITAYGFDFRTKAESSAEESKTSLIVAAAISVIAGLLLSFGTSYSFTLPIRRAMGMSEQIAAGNFDQAISTKRRDELGRLLVSLDKTRAALLEMTEARERERAEQLGKLQAEVESERQKILAMQNKTAEEQSGVIRQLASGLSDVAEGDLTCRLHGFPQSYTQIQDDFNKAVGVLQDTMVAIVGAAGQIQSGTSEFSHAVDDLAKRTETQAASLEETAAAVDEITATVRKTADGASHANSMVSKAKVDAEQSGEVVRRTISAMSEIEKSAKQISQIIGVIDEIAFQTNLLALNAGVEAARAGDAGRGFAVVASEVRSLAQRSAEAAKEIKGLISASTTQVDGGVKLVNETGKALDQIVSQVAEINQVVTEIASSAKEQAAGLGQVNTAINQMDQVTQQNAALVQESNAASHDLASEAKGLAALVSKFNVGEAPETSQQQYSRSEPVHQPRADKGPLAVQRAKPAPAPARHKGNGAIPSPAVIAQTRGANALAIDPRQAQAEESWEEF